MTFDDAWAADSCEFTLACNGEGNITWADSRARTRINAKEGLSLAQLAAPGMQDRLRTFLIHARESQTQDVEMPLLVSSRIETWALRGKPDGKDGVLILARQPPTEYRGALHQVEQSLTEVVELNRQILRQSREIERQRNELEKTVRELEESNRGVRTLHSELVDSAESARRATSMKSRVIANVSHEFRTPLHAILGLSRILLDGTDGTLTDEQRKQIRFMRTSVEELSTLVDDMLDLSRADAGRATLRPERFTVQDLMAALRGMLRPLVAMPENVSLTFEEPQEPVELETDRGKLSQILRNLVSNALKFTERGSVNVAVSVANGDIAFAVSDTGIGIPNDAFDHIFEEFGQIEGPLQSKLKGTGLGLALSRRLAEVLGGTLTVSSQVGRGSTFTLRLPRMHPEVTDVIRSKQSLPGEIAINRIRDALAKAGAGGTLAAHAAES